jgi:hypothetical protein
MHIDIKRTLKSNLAAISRQDAAIEQSHMKLFSIYRMLKFGRSPLTPEGEKAIERLDASLSNLVDARQMLENAHYQIETILKGT